MKNVGSLIGAVMKPTLRPVCPYFGSGPTKKRPGWTPSALAAAVVGRSHRSSLGKIQLNNAIKKTKDILNLPSDYLCGIVPASDTGAFEMALWNLLGPKPVDSVHFESFGAGWHTDITKQLKLKNVTEITAPYGQLPDLAITSPNHDIVFTWNGTTSGVMVPNADWINPNRTGLTLCDATSAVFSQPVDFKKCDVTTFSWQKVLGGEGAHGMLILSPRAVERLESYTPAYPLPKIFRLTKKGKLIKGIFEGETINTPSMLCVEDYIDALSWVEQQGGQHGIMKKTNENLAVLTSFVNTNPWMTFLAKDESSRSNTSVCLQLDLPKPKIKEFTTLLEKEGVAFDIGSYRDAPPGLRIWCGATVNKEDLEVLMPWLKWAYTQVA
jgi:phosphoserine aminotransferase